MSTVHGLEGAESFDVLIVGSGQAGVQAALSLRDGGFVGSIGMVSNEEDEPYQRPPLSKAYLKGEAEVDEFRFRSTEYWATHAIEILPAVSVESIDVAGHRVLTTTGRWIGYGRVIWAAGGRARTLNLPGADLPGVFSLRNHEDAQRLRAHMETARNAVIIGGGYIGLEAAAALSARNIGVTIIEVQDRLLARVTCAPVSDFYARLHRDAGASILLSSGVDEILGDDAGKVTGVRLNTGEVLPADLVIVGVGLIPNVEPLMAAGIVCSNGVEIDEGCLTSAPDVYAIGDCANFDNPFAAAGRVRLESVPNAVEHGKIVAAAILETTRPATAPPWFWSHQFDVRLQTVGLLTGHDEYVIRGNPEASRFSVVYLRDGRVIALDCVNSIKDFAQGKLLVERGSVVDRADLADPTVDLKELVAL